MGDAHKPHRLEHFKVVSCRFCRIGKGCRPVEGVAQMEFLDGFGCEAAVAQVLQAYVATFLGFCKVVLHLEHGPFVGHKHPLAQALPHALFIGHLPFLNLDAVFFRELEKGVVIADSLFLHYEIDWRPAFVA